MFYYRLAVWNAALLFSFVAIMVHYGSTVPAVALSALINGLFWQQLSFIAHDAGHNGITHSRSVDLKIGMFIANFLGGLSIGWWKKSHNVHHIVTNSPVHDPDIQ